MPLVEYVYFLKSTYVSREYVYNFGRFDGGHIKPGGMRWGSQGREAKHRMEVDYRDVVFYLG